MNFYSRGKLLISGEYLVLKGATALAVPLLKGQSLLIEETGDNDGILEWSSRIDDNEWFGMTLDLTLFEIVDTTDVQKAEKLIEIIRAAQKLNPDFLPNILGYKVITEIDFNLEWGLGSSSTLISNIACWAGINPFELHREVSDGSGYDVVAARKNSPFLFTLRGDSYIEEEVAFLPEFQNRLFFVYLGNKQDTAESIKYFLEKDKNYDEEIAKISEISRKLAEAQSLSEFEKYMEEHNRILSSVLNVPTLKETRFSDLDGEIKPLGAWGGDFALMTWNGDPGKIRSYLELKDIHDFFEFNELIKTK